MADEKTPEQIAAETQAAADKAAADKAAAEKAAADTAAAEAAAKAAERGGKDGGQSGEPKAPDKYDLRAVPEGASLTDGDLAGLEAEAKALGLTQAQAARLVQARVTDTKGYLEEQRTQRAALEADPELGGSHLQATLADVERAFSGYAAKVLSAEELVHVRETFVSAGLGNDRAFVKLFAELGKALAEDRPIGARPKAGSGASQKRTEDVMYPKSAVAAT